MPYFIEFEFKEGMLPFSDGLSISETVSSLRFIEYLFRILLCDCSWLQIAAGMIC